MTTFRLVFRARARKAWDKLDGKVRERFRKKLQERLANPRISAAKLRDMPNCYKIKLASVGYRLVYQVQDKRLVVLVLAVGPRENDEVYDDVHAELAQIDD